MRGADEQPGSMFSYVSLEERDQVFEVTLLSGL